MEARKFTLIDGSYSTGSAKEILFSLINDKIKFLNAKLYSFDEEFSRGRPHLSNRIEKLQAERNQMLEFLSQFNSSNHDVEIDCDIVIKVKSKELAS